MSDTVQIMYIGSIVMIVMFALAAVLDNPDNKELRRQFIVFALTIAVMFYKAIW